MDTIELFNTSKGVLIPDGIGSGDTTGVRQQLADAKAFQDAVPCWLHPQPVPLRDFHAEMFAVVCGAMSGKGPHSVKLVVEGHKFRCVPSVKGGVILYKDGGRNQYHHLGMLEWEQWATENHDV